MNVVLVHDWLIHMRGGEKVLEALSELYPEAEIYTLFYHREKLSPHLKTRRIRASFLHYLPGIRRYYRWLLPILPFAIRTLNLPKADLVISSSHCVAKAVRIPKGAKHVCYCHTPMRYLWGYEDEYFQKFPPVLRQLISLILHGLRMWDRHSNDKVNLFVSNSENVRYRIQRFYQREAVVVYPPVDLSNFRPGGTKKNYYLIVSAFVPYKRVDLAIDAFNGWDRELIVVGSGPLEKQYRKLAKTQNIRFTGSITGEQLQRYYREAKAVLFPTDEDFGIVPLEAQACGTPVIAYAKGGALESVRTGVFFESQTPESLRAAVEKFEGGDYPVDGISAKVSTFSADRFKTQIQRIIRTIVRSEKDVSRE